ncbi:MAG: helix-turn-helix transcriptional regulator [Bryobacteraceae bacterium]
MPKGEYLGEFEQLILLALLRLGDEGYGMRVRREIMGCTGRKVTIGAVYATLERLQAKGLVRSAVGEPSPERGGRGKRIFVVTGIGTSALRTSQDALRRMGSGVSIS